MRYIQENISEALIKRYSLDDQIKELNDPRYPLRFRYLSNRERGSWYYVRGGVWHWVGSYPLVKFARVRDMLPEIEINIASGVSGEAAVVGHFETVSGLLDWYLNRSLRRAKLTPLRKQGIKTAINRYLNPRLDDLLLVDISHHEIDKRLMMPLQERYSLSTVRLAFGVLKTAFKSATVQKLLDVNPLDSMRFGDFIPDTIQPKPAAFDARTSRAVFVQISRAKYVGRMFAWLMLLHGTRITETRLARWEHFDLVNQTWFIPAANTKTGKSITIPLTDTTTRLLSEYRQIQAKRGYRGVWAFRGSKISALTPKQANTIIQNVSGRQWTAHDLRKAFKGILGIVGTDYLVGEKLLNHSLTTLDKTYNQAELFDKMRAATIRAHEWLMTDETGKNEEISKRS